MTTKAQLNKYMCKRNLILIIILTTTICACSNTGDFKLPNLYRIDVQQGNVIDQKMIDRLKRGMDKEQVNFIMGTPAIIDPFHADQWEYIYSQSENGGTRFQQHIRMHFEDNKLTHIEGDVVTSLRQRADPAKQSRTVEVPIGDEKSKGFFERMINAIPFVGDTSTKTTEPEKQTTTQETTTD